MQKFWNLEEFEKEFKEELDKKLHKVSIGGFIDFSKNSDKKSGAWHTIEFSDGTKHKVLGE